MIKPALKSDCCGCGACNNICPVDAIELVEDDEGCEYPVVDGGLCIKCGACERVCPIANPIDEVPFAQLAFAVQNTDERILQESTSGGAFSAFAGAVLHDKGIVFGAGYKDDQPKVRHFGIEELEELSLFRNSKYVQSEVGYVFRKVKSSLVNGKRVLFSGTPCQIEGLLNFLGKTYENLYTINVVCRAVPCRLFFDAYLKWIESKTGNRAHRILFRDKRRFGYRYSNIAAYVKDCSDPIYSAGVESDPFLRGFFADIVNRPSCYTCCFKKRYQRSDITIYDCFEAKRFAPKLANNMGTTFVLVNSEKGERLFNESKNSIRYCEVDADLAVNTMPPMVERIPYNVDREILLSELKNGDAVSILDRWFPDSLQVKTQRAIRILCEKIHIYDIVKSIVHHSVDVSKMKRKGYRQ